MGFDVSPVEFSKSYLGKRTRVAEVQSIPGDAVAIVTGMSRIDHKGCNFLFEPLFSQLTEMQMVSCRILAFVFYFF